MPSPRCDIGEARRRSTTNESSPRRPLGHRDIAISNRARSLPNPNNEPGEALRQLSCVSKTHESALTHRGSSRAPRKRTSTLSRCLLLQAPLNHLQVTQSPSSSAQLSLQQPQKPILSPMGTMSSFGCPDLINSSSRAAEESMGPGLWEGTPIGIYKLTSARGGVFVGHLHGPKEELSRASEESGP